MSKEIRLEFKRGDRKSQAGVADLFAALLGRPSPEKCPACGGLKKSEADKGHTVVHSARCVCDDSGWGDEP